MKLFAWIGMLALAFLLIGPGPLVAKEAKYSGVEACGKCHKKKKDGEQLIKWQKAGHSKAFKVLGEPKAKEAAAKVGVSGDPQKAPECLVCHTTGFGEPASMFEKKFNVEDGVQCEACHGPGSLYKKKKTMQKIFEELGPDNKGDSPTARETGLIVPTEETCKRCHVETLTLDGKTYKNPNYEAFDFKKRLEKINHDVPR